MKLKDTNLIAAGIGAATVIAALGVGAVTASAQTEEPAPTPEETTATTPFIPTDRPDFANGETPWGDGQAPWGDGERPDFTNGEGPRFGGFGFGGFARGGFGSDQLAESLGLTSEQLTEAFEAGQTLPEIAEAAGINLDDLFAQRAADAQADLQAKVEAGELTQEHADQITARMESFATGERPDFANGERPWSNGERPDFANGEGLGFGGRFGSEGTAPWGDGPPPWATTDGNNN